MSNKKKTVIKNLLTMSWFDFEGNLEDLLDHLTSISIQHNQYDEIRIKENDGLFQIEGFRTETDKEFARRQKREAQKKEKHKKKLEAEKKKRREQYLKLKKEFENK